MPQLGALTPLTSGRRIISIHRLARAATVLTSPVLAEDAKLAAALVQLKIASLPDDTVLSYNPKSLTLVDGQNSTVTEIKNLALSNGRLVGDIVSVGGFLSMGERYGAIDPT